MPTFHYHTHLPFSFCIIALLALLFHSTLVHANFRKHARLDWGGHHHSVFQGITEDDATLTLDQISGSGIQSKKSLLYGSAEMHIKLVPGNSAGTVTAYFLSSSGEKHDEIDFEFLGNLSGQPYIIHTNLYTDGAGGREQQFHPWFDPTTHYHNYTIHWNPSQIVWYVDSVPIRVYRNHYNIPYPNRQAMRVYSSLWNADSWATRAGLDKIDWTQAPFVARLRHFRLTPYNPQGTIIRKFGSISTSSRQHWNFPKQAQLSKAEYQKTIAVRNKYMVYDYCGDSKRYNGLMPGECLKPQY